jgi:hypothetical protein
MLSKVLTLVQSKVALAVIGALAVSGGGAAVATAATGHVPFTNIEVSGHVSGTSTSGKSEANTHAHTVSVEGVLKSYSGSTISVQPHTGSAVSITVNSNTRVNGEHASKLSDLSKAVGHDVEVSATKDSKGNLTAWKVTVEGATNSSESQSNDHSGDTNESSHAQGTPEATHAAETRDLSGTVTAVSGTSFTVKTQTGTTVQVTISSQTRFQGVASALSSVKTGMRVSVQGTYQGQTTFSATFVETEMADH